MSYLIVFLLPSIFGLKFIMKFNENRSIKDIIIDYLGHQYIIELKIWRGQRYNEDGEKQICEYLEYFNLDTGYMLSFNFNKNKETGVKRVNIGDKILFEGIL